MIILNGSPNKKSHTMALVKKHFPVNDAEIFAAYTMDASPCDDCGLCARKPMCKFTDDTTRLIEALEAHDTLIIASPIHFAALSSPTLKVIGRFQELFNRKTALKRPIPSLKAVHIVATAGADDATMFEGLKRLHRILKSLFSADEGRIITMAGTDTREN